MTRPHTFTLALVLLAVAACAAACGDGATEPPAPTPAPPRATTLTVTPATVQLIANPDRAVLTTLYETTDGPNWVNKDNWLTDAPLGEWYGVDTDSSGRVVHLDLSGETLETFHRLRGPIPPEIGRLANLQTLNLDNNNLTGPIPPELGDLSILQTLDLGNLSLWGPIPPELGNLSGLDTLRLDNNGLTGPIPPELGNLSELSTLELYANQLTGPIPSELRGLSSLEELSAGGNGLSGPLPPELGELRNLRYLLLSRNKLAGPVPPEIGNLTNLSSLQIGWNRLTGEIPTALLDLQPDFFSFDENDGLCAPGSTAFAAWLNSLWAYQGPLCNQVDLDVLRSLYEGTDGTAWTSSDGWLGDVEVGAWHGVSADSLHRVTALDLTRNGLKGEIPAILGSLARLTELQVGGNALHGRLPQSLTELSLSVLDYSGTELCIPPGEAFRAWLETIPARRGPNTECAPMSDREILTVLYGVTDGPIWADNDGWLTAGPLGDWFGVDADGQGRVVGLSLARNNLRGRLPSELGQLSELRTLNLRGDRRYGMANHLSGPIPPALGNLSALEFLDLGGNDLSDSLPPELGRLTNLRYLALGDNALAGPIPPELGRLTNLRYLALGDNALAGPIPPEAGRLSGLRYLFLGDNGLSGPVPPEFGAMTALRRLSLSNNREMAGPLPADLTRLQQLEALVAAGTGLCAPTEPAFRAWLEGIGNHRIAPCGEGSSGAAYLTQAVQSRRFPVPLVAGEKALLRVFLTSRRETDQGIPAIRARLYVDGGEVHVADIPGSPTPIPVEVSEGDLSTSSNAEIPGHVVRPGLEMAIEVDPEGTLDPALGVAKRIPESGRLAVDVRTMPVFDLTVIPFIWSERPDSSIVDLARAMAADPDNHEMLRDTRTLLPVGDMEVSAHEPVLTSTNDAFRLHNETEAIRAMEGGTHHYYMGMMDAPTTGASGLGSWSTRSVFSQPASLLIAHEVGHALRLPHAPCGSARGVDPCSRTPMGRSAPGATTSVMAAG